MGSYEHRGNGTEINESGGTAHTSQHFTITDTE